MQGLVVFCLAGGGFFAGGFALGYYLAQRKHTKQTIRDWVEHEYIMAGVTLSIIEAIKNQRYENALQTLNSRVMIALHGWVRNKDKFSEKRICDLDSSAAGQCVQKYGAAHIDQAKALELAIDEESGMAAAFLEETM